jgi:Ca2+-binding RTX toxin-like protein
MTLHAFNSNVLFPTHLQLGYLDQVVVGNNGFIYREGMVLYGTDSRNTISVSGVIASGSTAFLFSAANPLDGGCQVMVTQSGLISARTGIEYIGTALTLTNAGAIHSTLPALAFDGGAVADSHKIINSGLITGNSAIYADGTQLTRIHLTNTGEMVGTSGWAINLSPGSLAWDRVINAGLITGEIHLGGGADTYDGRRGGVVVGQIDGNAGDDMFRPGAAEEAFVGGDGIDVLDFRRGGGAVEIALDLSWSSTGWAEGDTWLGIENVFGTIYGDLIGGDAGANILEGLAGADKLFGQAGGDQLWGGGGVDTLTGGAGNDSFSIWQPRDGGDIITDFSSAAAGNNDRFVISGLGFPGGLLAGNLPGAQFRSRADNSAQDADDRFIFRTTDTTLWFDADGTGAAAAVLVADLQAGASMTAADIFIL